MLQVFIWLCLLVQLTHGQYYLYVVDPTLNSGPILKSGLGALFGTAGPGGPNPPVQYMYESGLRYTQGQTRPTGTPGTTTVTACAPSIRAAQVWQISRLNDLIAGQGEYAWPGLSSWLGRVKPTMQALSQNYKDTILCVSVFNEPDTHWYTEGTPYNAFMNDTQVKGTKFIDRIGYVWTQTVNLIRSIDPDIKVLGPNFQIYTPYIPKYNFTQQYMEAFLTNAINTNTIPDYMGWHQLFKEQGYAAQTLQQYYRPLENQLQVPGRPLPVVIEEYGPCTVSQYNDTKEDFNGVPGSMMKYMGDLERYRFFAGNQGLYSDASLIGNSMRYLPNNTLAPNAGFWLYKWYNDMPGDYVYTSRFDLRYEGAFDGVSSYDSQNQIIQTILGGSSDYCMVQFYNMDNLAWGTSVVRVRLERTSWEFSDPNYVMSGGDVKLGVELVYDKRYNVDDNGILQIPIFKMYEYDAYKLTVSPLGVTYDTDPTFAKYEAESAFVSSGLYTTGYNAVLCSNNSFVTLGQQGSYIDFSVNDQSPGIYVIIIRFSAQGGGTQNILVNGQGQGTVQYSATSSGANRELSHVQQRIQLNEDQNTITLAYATNSVDIDYIALRPYIQSNYRAVNVNFDQFQCNNCTNCKTIFPVNKQGVSAVQDFIINDIVQI